MPTPLTIAPWTSPLKPRNTGASAPASSRPAAARCLWILAAPRTILLCKRCCWPRSLVRACSPFGFIRNGAAWVFTLAKLIRAAKAGMASRKTAPFIRGASLPMTTTLRPGSDARLPSRRATFRLAGALVARLTAGRHTLTRFSLWSWRGISAMSSTQTASASRSWPSTTTKHRRR
ncbi:MAG: hypothetical protein BWX73_03073 [Lentisphaerae bacterium ADurb.Bin082]|nr:MAG: hypothetical protein BWX73_03073 [Lentisphaerae bacterium ADurb.Bin082]